MEVNDASFATSRRYPAAPAELPQLAVNEFAAMLVAADATGTAGEVEAVIVEELTLTASEALMARTR